MTYLLVYLKKAPIFAAQIDIKIIINKVYSNEKNISTL